jgi:hypothetical protein
MRTNNTPAGNGPPAYSTSQEMANELRICVRTLTRLAAAGKIPGPVLVASCKRWNRQAVLAAIEKTKKA